MVMALDTASELDVLVALGFGPETLLMSEPKIFLDNRFLSALLVELEDQLDALGSRRALFQIGLLYGFRDAYRIAGEDGDAALPSTPGSAETTLLALSLGQYGNREEPGQIEISGSWPEHYEAEARLAKLGPNTCPSCALSAGYTSGWLSGTLESDIFVVERSCAASGDPACNFVARNLEAWHTDGGAQLALLPELSFEVFRNISRGYVDPNPSAAQATLDFDTPLVQVWGPVMVLPFVDIDEAMHTVEMLGRDPETSSVRAVVIDLRSENIDEGFAAAALERILETIEAWGAEAILTNVSPVAERIVSELEVRHLLLRKDLPEAVAAAFQIAEAQRQLL
jgi:anti-anti-sigma regulatory factor